MNHEAPSPQGVAAFNGYRWMSVLVPLGALGYTFLAGTFDSLRALLWLPLGTAIVGGIIFGVSIIWLLPERTIKKQIASGLVGAMIVPLPLYPMGFSLWQPDLPAILLWYGLLFFFMGLPFWIFPNRLKAMIGPAGPYETMRLID